MGIFVGKVYKLIFDSRRENMTLCYLLSLLIPRAILFFDFTITCCLLGFDFDCLVGFDSEAYPGSQEHGGTIIFKIDN